METFETGKEALLAYHQDEQQQQQERDKDDLLNLPPGFRFHPTDEEIILHYLIHKVSNHDFVARAIGEVDLNKVEPWDLPKKAKMGEKEWWFFCQRDRKYPTGMRTNRATETGYWKATGKDKEIFKGKSNFLVGMKKTLVFYKGRAPKGEKSNWVMHEFRLEGQFSYNKSTRDAEWVVCRVCHKSTGVVRGMTMENDENNQMDSFVDNLIIHSPSTLTLPALTELSPNYASKSPTNVLYNHQQQQHDFKPIPLTAPSSSHGNNNSPYFPFTYMLHPHSGSANPPVGSAFYPHTGGFNGYAVNVDSAAIAKQLMKVEPSSYNNVSGSQETGLSMEVATNTETTSALSKSKQIVDDQSSPRPFDDLDGDPSYHDGDMDDDLVDPYAFWDGYGTDNP